MLSKTKSILHWNRIMPTFKRHCYNINYKYIGDKIVTPKQNRFIYELYNDLLKANLSLHFKIM